MDITIELDAVTVQLPQAVSNFLQSLADKSGDDVAAVILDRLAAGMDAAEEAA